MRIMTLSEHIRKTYRTILREELLAAMGCTEPIAIAYAGAILAKIMGCRPETVCAKLSGNIIKNVKSGIVPATGGMHGIEAALCAGIVACAPEKRLEVLTALSAEDQARIKECLHSIAITVEELESAEAFDLLLVGEGNGHSARVRICRNHTNVVLVEKDGEDRTEAYLQEELEENDSCADRSLLNVKDIVAFAETEDLTELKPFLLKQLELNMTIAEEGLRGDYGASIGKLLYRNGSASLRDRARAYAAAGSDARMSGCELPVCILSGSGNQGITASVPVAVYAKELGADEETKLRALLISDLITIHQKTGIGCLSAYCGAISAGCGAATGICYLYGGRYYEIAHTLVNAIAILSGTICDGAKPSCAAKIAMAVEAGIMGYEMTASGHQFYGGDGIITKGVENTIANVGRLARDGMSETDREIIRIMLKQPNKCN